MTPEERRRRASQVLPAATLWLAILEEAKVLLLESTDQLVTLHDRDVDRDQGAVAISSGSEP